MSIRPGRIKEIVEIDIPRPRDRRLETEGGRRATELRQHVLELVLGAGVKNGSDVEKAVAS
jgi:hypothetical protein